MEQENEAESNGDVDAGTVAGATVGGLACLAALGGGAYLMIGRCICNKVSPFFR